jgi:short-subunit dehydrogenase
VVDTFGSADLVINNAGVALAARAVEQTAKDATEVIDVDLLGVVHGTQAFLPHLLASGDGHLVNISSLFGLIAMPYNSAYNAAKFGVRGYTESIATVHCVHPGGILTNIARNAEARGEWSNLDEAFDRIAHTSPERCAEVILTGVLKGRKRILVGADAWAMHLLQQTFGVRGLGLLRRGIERVMDHTGMRATLDDTSTAQVNPTDPATPKDPVKEA